MSVTSMVFLFLFLPLSLAVYHLAGDSKKDYVLLVISMLFYSLCSLPYILLFSAAIVINILVGRILHHAKHITVKRCLLILGIILNTGLLVYYKYSDFILNTWGNITSTEVHLRMLTLPLGISFFTFKAISYLIDIYRGTAVLVKNPFHDALYCPSGTRYKIRSSKSDSGKWL